MKASLLRFRLPFILVAGAFVSLSIAQTAFPARETAASPVTQVRTPSVSPPRNDRSRTTLPRNSVVTLVTSHPSAGHARTKNAAIQSLQAQALEEVESLLPASCANRDRSIYVRYDHPEKRGLAGKSAIIVSGNLPLQEFRAVLVHEMLGHFNDLGCLQGTPKSGESPFRDGSEVIFNDDPSTAFYGISWISATERRHDSHNEDFVSGYAKQDPFEDVAESVAFYVLHREEFKRRAQENPMLARKLAWIQTYAQPGVHSEALSMYTWDSGDIPWDVTKLSYVWMGQEK